MIQTAARPRLDCPEPILPPGMVGLRRVDVSDSDTVLTVTFQGTFPPPGHPEVAQEVVDRRKWVLTGGARIHPRIVGAAAGPPGTVVLTLDQGGDFSVYTLTLLGEHVDPVLASLDLRFRLRCELPFDCRPGQAPALMLDEEPVAIDYLAKDYTSFRQALLDFIPTRLAEWTERSEADVSIALLELLAATGDALSYQQDRVANEAFLSTALQRRSVQNHLALLGYQLDPGSAAYTWLQFQVAAPHRLDAGFAVSTAPTANQAAVVFETLSDRLLVPEQNEMRLYDWGTPGCCLASGSTTATLIGSLPSLSEGDYLAFEDTQSGARDVVRLTAPPSDSPVEVPLAVTLVSWSRLTPLQNAYCVDTTVVRGNLAVATHGATSLHGPDLSEQEVVQSGEVASGQDASASVGDALAVPGSGPPGTLFQLTAWGFQPGEQVESLVVDAGTTTRATSAPLAVADQNGVVTGVTVATTPADRTGKWTAEFTGLVSLRQAGVRWSVTPPATGQAAGQAPGQRPPRKRATLEQAPLTFIDASTRALVDPVGAAPPDPFAYERRSIPQLTLDVDGKEWRPVLSLLESGAADEVYQVDSDDEGRPTIMFGRGGEPGADPSTGFGRRPDDTSRIVTTYRVGLGGGGNVAADTLTLPEPSGPWLQSVTNPVPARGGRDPESRQHAITVAPPSIEKRLVAVTAADYEAAAASFTDAGGQKLIARSKADFRWTGSWLTVNLIVQPEGTDELSPQVADGLAAFLDGRRLAGYDVQVRPAFYLPVQLELNVCTAPGFNQSDVQRSLEQALSNRVLPGGALGFFHPDNFSFGDSLAISRLYRAIMAVPGVQSVDITTLCALHSPQPQVDTNSVKQSGFLTVAPDQVLQLDNDPNFPEHGNIRLRFGRAAR